MSQNIIAIICDCDDTLTKDTTSLLLEDNEIKVNHFWKKIKKQISQGWDPPMAWMNEILMLMNEDKIKQNTNQKLFAFGKKIKPFKGVPNFLHQLKKIVQTKKYSKYSIKIESYIISSGIEDLIKGTKFSNEFINIFGSRFFEDPKERKITKIKSIVSFTEKTKFLYAINKGIKGVDLRKNPFLVNDRVKKSNRRIPFENMIYIGDSSGDVPCFSAIKYFGGKGIAILSKNKIAKGYQLAKERRVTAGSFKPIFTRSSTLRLHLDHMVKEIADEIVKKS